MYIVPTSPPALPSSERQSKGHSPLQCECVVLSAQPARLYDLCKGAGGAGPHHTDQEEEQSNSFGTVWLAP
eukprot:scaffold86025_cov18-Tisochrysis_lutea.AAC.1